MSVWMNLLVAPKMPFTMSREQFSALVSDLVDQDLVTPLCAILGNTVSVGSPLHMGNTALLFPKEKPGDTEIYYKGVDSISLLKTLREVPYGQTDLCVWFDCFNWKNPDINESFQQQGFANADVLLYALAEPTTTQCYNLIEGEIGPEHSMQYCFRTTGKSGPYDIAGTPLEPLLKKHLGADLIVDCTYA